MTEEENARDATPERKQPQAQLGKAQPFDRRQLDEQEEDRTDLPVIERAEHFEIAAVEQVRRQHRFIAPERTLRQVPDHPQKDPDRDESQGRPRNPRGVARGDNLQRGTVPRRRLIPRQAAFNRFHASGLPPDQSIRLRSAARVPARRRNRRVSYQNRAFR